MAATLLAAAAPFTTQPVFAQGPESVANVAEGLLDSVVNISTSQNAKPAGGGVQPPTMPEGTPFNDMFKDFFENAPGQTDPQRDAQSLGSGFVLDAQEGIIVTNNHVIADADIIEVNFADGEKLPATLIGKDAETDLAVLKVDPAGHALKAVSFGDSNNIRVGDWVMAIGNPFGLGGSVSVGIISARNRNINAGPYDDFIQTDAAINRGNSGGPLFNMNGEVIGINTAIISPSGGSIGIGFSIPSSLAMRVVEQLREFGETRRGWLGVRIQPVTEDIAESMKLPGDEGALVSGVTKGGPVDNGILKAGDVITAFDGQPIKTPNELQRVVAETAVDKQVEITIIREGKEEKVSAKLGRREEGTRAAEEATPETLPDQPVETLGMKLAMLDEEQRAAFQIGEGVKGVVITEVAENTGVAEKGVKAGDVIVEIGQEAVEEPQQVVDRISRLREEGRRNGLLMLASKDGQLRFVAIPLD
nr:Do family serine endopeptidase [Limoniibacter endophyticus]